MANHRYVDPQSNGQMTGITENPFGTILAFDFGKRRIGVAIGDSALQLARPLVTIDNAVTERCFTAIAKLIETWQPVLLVVGLPTHEDGGEHELTRLSRRFARRLAGRFRLEIVLIDERYTSITASVALKELGVRGKKQKPILDQMAAQQILQSFFDDNHAVT